MSTAEAVKQDPGSTEPLEAPEKFPAIQCEWPECTMEYYAEGTGLPIGSVKYYAENRLIPTLKRGKRRLINLVKIRAQNAEA